MKLEFSREIFEESSNTKFYKIPSFVSRVFPSVQTDGRMDRQTDITDLAVTLTIIANARRSELNQCAVNLP